MKQFITVIIVIAICFPSVTLAITLGDGGSRSYIVNKIPNTGPHLIIHRPDIIIPHLLRKDTCPTSGCDDCCESLIHSVNQYGLVHKAAQRPHTRVLIPEQAAESTKR